MTSDELYDLFRKDVVDTVQPYLWSDDEVYAYMNDAYYMFVRMTGGISDFTSAACTVAAVANQPVANINPAILVIRQASLDPSGDAVRVINAQDMERLSDEDYGVLRQINTSVSKGRVRYMVMGMEQGKVRWVNTPDVNYTVKLIIDRLPLTTITDGGQQFEGVNAHHHFHFLQWMRHLAYGKQDAETFDKTRSGAEKQMFEQYCYLAKMEKDRYKHKVRVVAYGGI